MRNFIPLLTKNWVYREVGLHLIGLCPKVCRANFFHRFPDRLEWNLEVRMTWSINVLDILWLWLDSPSAELCILRHVYVVRVLIDLQWLYWCKENIAISVIVCPSLFYSCYSFGPLGCVFCVSMQHHCFAVIPLFTSPCHVALLCHHSSPYNEHSVFPRSQQVALLHVVCVAAVHDAMLLFVLIVNNSIVAEITWTIISGHFFFFFCLF